MNIGIRNPGLGALGYPRPPRWGSNTMMIPWPESTFHTRSGTAGRLSARARPAFTLFELLLVCAVIIVLGAAVYPSIEEMYSGYRISASADQVRAAWAQARTHAMDEGRPYRFSVKPGTSEFRVAPDSSAYWSGSDEPQPDDDRTNPPLIKTDAISKPIVFNIDDEGSQAPPDPLGIATQSSVGQSDGVWTTLAIFLP